MVGHAHSASSDIDDSSPSPPPNKPSKTHKLQKKSVPEAALPLERARRDSHATSKKAELDKENQMKIANTLARLQKENKVLRKQNQEAVEIAKEAGADLDDLGLESEEKDDDPPPTRFSNSNQSRGVVVNPKRPPKKSLRKEGDPKPLGDRTQSPRITAAARNSPPLQFPLSISGSSPQATSHTVQHEVVSSLSRSRARSRSASPHDQRVQKRRRSHSGSRAPRIELAPAFRNGVEPSNRPKASDYEPNVYRLIMQAIRFYECMLYTDNAYPEVEQQIKWTAAAWQEVGKEGKDQYELTERISGLIRNRGSHARGDLKDHTRPHIASTYSFERGSSPAIKARNKELYLSLMENKAFRYKDVTALTGLAENKIVSMIIQETWFHDKRSLGVIFSERFSPVQLPMLALIFTMVEFGIEEWSTGHFVQAKLREHDDHIKYEQHLQDLVAWDSLAPVVVRKIRQKFHDRCRRNAGVAALDSSAGQMSQAAKDRVRNELAARTGDTDSEADVE